MSRPSSRTPRGPEALAAIIAPVLEPLLRRRGFSRQRIITDWAEIVGTALADRTLPEKVSWARGGATLYVRIESGAVALELQHLQPQILDRINGYFGYPAISRLKLLHGPLPKHKPVLHESPPLSASEEEAITTLTSTVGDNRLRETLQRLGCRIAQRRDTLD